MYFWRCVFSVALGLLWYCSDYGYVLLMVFFCVVSFLIEGGHSKQVCESSTQTHCGTDQVTVQQIHETDHIVGRDEPDSTVQTVQKVCQQSQYPNIQRSLQHMFKCVYTHLVLPWSSAPELGGSQPLHTALLTEFNFIMDEIISKAKDLDLSVISLGCIQIFTQHLHNAKKSEGLPAFSSKAEEIAVVRGFCDGLIHNLIPAHLWEANVYYCVLQEIMATKALEFVTLLSDPDNLNHLIISQLDQMPSDNLVEEVQDSDRNVPSSNSIEDSDVLQGDVEEHTFEGSRPKKKGRRLRESLIKRFNRMKDKLKRKEKEVRERDVTCRTAAVMVYDDTSSSDGSMSDNIDSDVGKTSCCPEDMIEFKLSYEMWKVGNWAVTITNVQMEGNELCFTVHLEEISNPEYLHWDVQKNQSDIIQFYNQCKDTGNMSSMLTIVEKPKTEWEKDEARDILEHSLQDLVKNAELSDSEHVFKFLGPIDWIHQEEEHDEWVWVLLGRIASFLTPGQDEDELNNHQGDEKQHKVMYDCSTSEATPQHDLPECTGTLDEGLLLTDGGQSPTPEQMSTCTSDEQVTDFFTHFFDHPESAGINILQCAAKTKYLKFEPNVKRQAAAADSDENGVSSCTTDPDSVCNYNGNISKEQNLLHRKSEMDIPESKGKDLHPDEETFSQSPGAKKNVNSSQLEANKVIFDLLKEISGNSCTFKFMKAVVTPFTPLINKKVHNFLKKMNPSEAQIATYIDRLCESIWPDGGAVPQPVSQSSDKNEIKQKAMQIMTSKFAGFAINKTSVENIFKMFQDAEDNKKLIYMLLKYVLREFLPGEPIFNVTSLNVKSAV